MCLGFRVYSYTRIVLKKGPLGNVHLSIHVSLNLVLSRYFFSLLNESLSRHLSSETLRKKTLHFFFFLPPYEIKNIMYLILFLYFTIYFRLSSLELKANAHYHHKLKKFSTYCHHSPVIVSRHNHYRQQQALQFYCLSYSFKLSGLCFG